MPTSTFAVPPTQNTAPVIEFRCLYTHDLRRKQKRWNDGTLKFHTFNKRVMVYDGSMNYISDAHWKEEMLQDGNEVTLQNGVMVEVSEALRTTETDLTPLFAARQRPAAEQPTRTERSTAGRTIIGGPIHRRDVPRQKHKPLTALLGTSNGALGKAVIQQSPYAARHNLPDPDSENEPSAKKQKGNAVSDVHSWKMTAVTKKTSSKLASSKTAPLQPRTSGAQNSKTPKTTRKSAKPQPAPVGQTTLRVKQVIDITSDADCTPLQSDLTFSDPSPTKPRTPEKSQLSRNPSTPNRDHSPIYLEPPSPRMNSADRAHNVHASLTSRRNLRANRERNPRARAIQLSKAKSKPKLLCMQDGSIKETQPPARATMPDLVLSEGDEGVQEPPRRKRASRHRSNSQVEVDEMDTDGIPPPQEATEEDAPGLLNEPAPGPRILKAQPTRRPPSESPRLNVNNAFHRPTSSMSSSSPERISTDLHETGIASGRMDQQLLQSRLGPSATSRLGRSPNRPLRRIQSENDSPRERNSQTEQTSATTTANIVPSRGGTTSRATASSRQVPLHRVRTIAEGQWSGLPSFRQPMKPLPKEPTIRDVGPWSTEAFDLFDWHPPDWEERVSKIPASVAMID